MQLMQRSPGYEPQLFPAFWVENGTHCFFWRNNLAWLTFLVSLVLIYEHKTILHCLDFYFSIHYFCVDASKTLFFSEEDMERNGYVGQERCRVLGGMERGKSVVGSNCTREESILKIYMYFRVFTLKHQVMQKSSFCACSIVCWHKESKVHSHSTVSCKGNWAREESRVRKHRRWGNTT